MCSQRNEKDFRGIRVVVVKRGGWRDRGWAGGMFRARFRSCRHCSQGCKCLVVCIVAAAEDPLVDIGDSARFGVGVDIAHHWKPLEE